MSCCSSACGGQRSSCNSSMSFCYQEPPPKCCDTPSVACRPIFPTRTPPCPLKTVVYLRPKCPPCCPMPCPPKAVVTTYPRCDSQPPPPPPKINFICTYKRIPVLPPPPPTPPVYSPCRPRVASCSTN